MSSKLSIWLKQFRDFFQGRNTNPSVSPDKQPLLSLNEFYEKARSRKGFSEETTSVLHNDFYAYAISQKNPGKGIIEIGCYKGSTSIVLAYICRELRMPFYTLDINAEYLEYTHSLLKDLGLARRATFFLGPMSEFVKAVTFSQSPFLVFVDGDHNYDAVLNDIQAIYSMPKRPFAIAFHDFSLRSFQFQGIRVDQAIYKAFGEDVALKRIGLQMGSNPIPPKENPDPYGTYWELDGTEAVIVETGGVKQLQI